MAAVGGACLLGYDLSSSLRCVGKYRLGVFGMACALGLSYDGVK